MKTLARPRRTVFRLHSVLIGLILLATVSAVASHAVDSQVRIDNGRTSIELKTNSPMTPTNRRFSGWVWTPSFAAVAGETVEVFDADCTTPKTSFTRGETVCAKTAGVDLSDGTHNVNWVSPTLATTNGGTITQNPQTFLFSLPTSNTEDGLWKVTIGRTGHSTLPDDASIIGDPPTFTVEEGAAMATFTGDCLTPKTVFVLGETVCARATGLVGFRFAWQDAAGYIEKRTDITTDPQTDTFELPSTQTSVIDDVVVDNRGQWRANAVTSRNSVRRSAFFTVKDPANPVVDLSITKSRLGDNPQQGGQVQYLVRLINNGPDAAANVRFLDDTFTGMTFDSVTETSGLGFICTGSGIADCTISTLPVGKEASFLLNFTAGSAGSSVQNTAEISSDTAEQNTLDNTYTTAAVPIGSGTPPPACTLNCPNNINANANTEENNQRGAYVDYAAPVVSDETECGAVTSTPASGSFFPVGTTTVVATSESGNGSCSFTITVSDTGEDPPTISCPVDKTGTADGTCAAAISVGTATATGTNVTVIGFRSDGRPMYTCDVNGTNCVRNSSDEPFAAGVTTITWFAYSHNAPGPYADADDEEARRTGSASCTQRVTVNDVTAPTITATSSTAAADANCQAAVPDYSNSATDNCACSGSDASEVCDERQDIVVTQSIAAGTLLGPGTYSIDLAANDGSSNNNGAGNTATKTITFTVEDQTPPAIDCPDNIETTTDPGTCSAVVDPGTATATDNCDATPTIVGTRSDSQPLNAPYPAGTTTITWKATDDEGNYSECNQTVTVVDDEAPVITFSTQTTSLWPPNHSYHSFSVSNFVTSVSDNCDSIPVSSVYITKITSDEAENGGGDGNTLNDILIGADCKSFQLRAERAGSGNGRVYTIHFKVNDGAGNATTGTATVVVRKSPPQAAVDSGPNYTVNSGCP